MEYEAAIVDFDQAITLDPNYSDAYYNRGNANSKLAKYESAIVDFDQAIRLKPDFASAFNNRGVAKNLLVEESDRDLAKQLVSHKAIPEKAFIDAVHVAVAARNAVPYLATWNFTHLANPQTRPQIERICSNAGYPPPYIDSPKAILEKF